MTDPTLMYNLIFYVRYDLGPGAQLVVHLSIISRKIYQLSGESEEIKQVDGCLIYQGI